MVMTEERQRYIAPYAPLPWQIKPLRDVSPVLLLTGSAGGGKSRIAAEKLNLYCKKYAGAMALALRKTRESMVNSTVLFLERTVIAGDPDVIHVSTAHRFEYSNGSIFAYGGMKDEEQREQIRSIGQAGGLDIAWMEEANKFTRADYNEVKARMRGRAAPWRQIVLTCNPDAASHWIHQDLILGGEAQVYYSHAVDNPYNPASYLESLKGLTGVQGKRLRDGLWIQAEGIVYEDYDPEIHLVPRSPIPSSWARYRVIDFGYTNPFVCQWWAVDPDGRLYRYREIYLTKKLVEDAAQEIFSAETTRYDGELPVEMEYITETICDHDAEDRATLERHLSQLNQWVKNNQQDYIKRVKKELGEEPVIRTQLSSSQTRAAEKSVKTGIENVQKRLKVQEDGKPRLFLMQGALIHQPDPRLRSQGRPTCTEEEISVYGWHPDATGKPNMEEPVKEDDHGMDAMRYMVQRRDARASVQLLWV